MLALIVRVAIFGCVALAIHVVSRPSGFRILRLFRLALSRETLFADVDDLHNFDFCLPGAALDPAMHQTHSGAAGRVGAACEGKGDRKVGHGRMETVEASEPERVLIPRDVFKSFAARNLAEYFLAERDGDWEFTWAMCGPNALVAKARGLFFRMDRVAGGQFEQGFAGLKAIAERRAA